MTYQIIYWGALENATDNPRVMQRKVADVCWRS